MGRWLVALAMLGGCGRIAFDVVGAIDSDAAIDPDTPPSPYDPSLVLWLAMDDDPTNGVADSSGAERNGTCAECPSIGMGAHGSGYQFDGIDDFVSIPGNIVGLPTADFTWETWVSAQDSNIFQAVLVSSGQLGGNGGLEINLDQARMQIFTHGSLQQTSVTLIPDNTWAFLAATRAGNVVTIYVNATASPTFVDGAAMDFMGCPLLVGVDNDSGCVGILNGFLDGNIDEVRIYRRALSASELAMDMMSPTPLMQ